MLQKVEYEDWLTHPVTKEFFQLLKAKREDIKERWAMGAFTDETLDGTKQLNAEAIGWVYMLDQILEMNYEGLVEELADAK